MRFRLRFRVRTLLIVMTLICVYLGAYRALMKPKLVTDFSSNATGGIFMVRTQTEHYVAAPRFCHLAFYPIHRLDRWIRSSYWARVELEMKPRPASKPYFLLHYPGQESDSDTESIDSTRQPVHTELQDPVY